MPKELLGLDNVNSELELKMRYRGETGFPETRNETEKFYTSKSDGYEKWLSEKLLLAARIIAEHKKLSLFDD